MKLPHDRSDLLNISNSWYKKTVLRFFKAELEQDGDDVTTALLDEHGKQHICAVITAKSSGILAGMEEVDVVIQEFFPTVRVEWHTHSSQDLQKGVQICTLRGDAKDILKIERPLLNMLMRMSGIATETKRLSLLSPLPIASTRKTLWGPLDKKAVSLGGGLTHRLRLLDAVLLKENHLSLLGELDDISSVMKNISSSIAFFEVEVETEEEFWTVYDIFKNTALPTPKVIMFDNFEPHDIAAITKHIEREERRENNIFLEASGGITEESLSYYKNIGVDVLSMSSITMQAKSLDMSLYIEGGL